MLSAPDSTRKKLTACINLGMELFGATPPYGREIGKWVFTAAVASGVRGTTVVMLLPARTDTRWFHEYIYQKDCVEIRFIRGRLKFGGSKNSAPFPSMVVIFRGEREANKK